MILFKDFLQEGITPSRTPFGTDLEDNSFNAIMGTIFTFFKNREYYYYVAFNQFTNEFAFGVSETFSKNIDDYSTNRKMTKNAMAVFSKVFYIFLQMEKEFNISSVKFAANKSDLGEIYEKLSKNALFLKNMKKNGFKYVGKEGEFYVYSK